MNKINLQDTTFIIPVRVESSDRLRNIHCSITYLTKHFDTNIIVAENDKQSVLQTLYEEEWQNKNITKLWFPVDITLKTNPFHRTFLLNEMLEHVKTKVVVNYDTDIILPLESYVKAQEMCLNGFDLVYPYEDALDGQIMAEMDYNCYTKFLDNPSVELLHGRTWSAKYGFCQFFKTDSYKSGFMENENFISYGPEDVERYERWVKLGYNVGRIKNKVYHIEHSRTNDSTSANPLFDHNNKLYDQLKSLDKKETIEYYKNQNYVKSRTKL